MLVFLVIILVFLFFLCVVMYNTLIRKRNAIDQAYYSIDAQLRKRYDLIPMIVDTVKGYMAHEKDVLESLTKIRTHVLQGNLSVNEKVGSDNQINHIIERVVLMAERYPVLKANPSFIHLQGVLNESEEQLAAARRFLNAAVADYHNAIQQFPSNIIASFCNMKARNYFFIRDEEKVRPVLYINKPV